MFAKCNINENVALKNIFVGVVNILKFICAVRYISCVIDLVISDHFTLAGSVTMHLRNSKHVWECDINVCNYVCGVYVCRVAWCRCAATTHSICGRSICAAATLCWRKWRSSPWRTSQSSLIKLRKEKYVTSIRLTFLPLYCLHNYIDGALWDIVVGGLQYSPKLRNFGWSFYIPSHQVG